MAAGHMEGDVDMVCPCAYPAVGQGDGAEWKRPGVKGEVLVGLGNTMCLIQPVIPHRLGALHGFFCRLGDKNQCS